MPQHKNSSKNQSQQSRPQSTNTTGSNCATKPVSSQKSTQKPGSLLQYRWVPKTTLKAQGYYEGQTSVWLPKQKKTSIWKPITSSNPISAVTLSKTKATTPSHASSNKKVWLPKTLRSRCPTIKERARLLHEVFVHTLTQEVAVQLLANPQRQQHCATQALKSQYVLHPISLLQ